MSDELKRGLRALTSKNPSLCNTCGHVPIRHRGGVCATCVFIMEQRLLGSIIPAKYNGVCRETFNFRLKPAELEQAKKADKFSYEQDDICANCGQYWMLHEGYLCPTGDSTFVLLFKGGTET